MRLLPVLLLLGLALAGCAADDDPAGVVTSPAVPGVKPVLVKSTFQSTAPAQPVVPLLPAEATPAFGLEVGSGTAGAHFAFDLQADGPGTLDFRVVAPDGQVLKETQVEATAKVVVVPQPLQMGSYEVYAESTAQWSINVVMAKFPAGFEAGHVVTVSTPDQTEIEHRFYPQEVQLAADTPARLTLYDYDPHAGTANLQHNIHVPELGVKTDGKTTWGEVRVLDLPGLAAGSYAFECEFHGFTGTLVVA